MANTTTKFDVRTGAAKVFYAGVGVNDLAVEKVRSYVADVQARVAKAQQEVDQPRARPQGAARPDRGPVAELQAGAKTYPGKVQALVDDNVDTATALYGDLVKRGETLVGRIRRQQSTKATVTQAKSTTAKAKTTTTQAKKTGSAAKTTAKSAAKKATKTSPARKKAATTKSSAKATATTATKTASSATQAVTDAAKKVGD